VYSVHELRLYRLAAVDMHTAHHIYEQCISGELLRDRTVILVTHHIALCLPNASYLIELSGGQIAHQGTIEELRRAGHLGHIEDDESPIVGPVTDSPASASPPANEGDLTPEGEKQPLVSKSLKGKLIEAEARAEGRVHIFTYLTYLRACGWSTWVATICLMLFMRGITIALQVRIPCLCSLS
jgi:ABC-type multidrug transport system ATPase subunit